MKTVQTNYPNSISSEPNITDTLPCERRLMPRIYPSILSAVLDAGEQRWVVMIGDISLSGARILNAPPELSVGDTLCLATLLNGCDTMTVPCTVVRMEGNEAHAQLGVRFEASDSIENSPLDRYLRLHMHSNAECGVDSLTR